MILRKEGFPFIITSGILSYALSRTRLGLAGWTPAMFVTWFFRDPQRTAPESDGAIICPADGTVMDIEETIEEKVGECQRIPIFMSVFNVHVNRAPVNGRVLEKLYKPGKFYMANLGKKTELNERMVLYVQASDGVYRVDQVAGMIARRISCWPEPDDEIEAGQRIGLIRFGSLVECYVPKELEVTVKKGDKVQAGTTIIARRRA